LKEAESQEFFERQGTSVLVCKLHYFQDSEQFVVDALAIINNVLNDHGTDEYRQVLMGLGFLDLLLMLATKVHGGARSIQLEAACIVRNWVLPACASMQARRLSAERFVQFMINLMKDYPEDVAITESTSVYLTSFARFQRLGFNF
jgi:hypothetical protein